MKKTILMILNQAFPDIRVEQEYHSLVASGYRVIIVTRASKTTFDENYELLPIDVSQYKFEAYLNCLFIGNPWLTHRITSALCKMNITKIDAIHVHDLFWAITGQRLSQKFGAKFVIDFHENYPAMIQHFNDSHKKNGVKKTLRNQFFDHVLLSYKRLVNYEKRMLSMCDAYITVAEEALLRLKNINPNKYGIVVSNTKVPEKITFTKMPDNEKIKLIYVGTIQELRGLETAVKAMKYLAQDKYELTIIGFKGDCLVKKNLNAILLANNIRNVNLIDYIEDEPSLNQHIKSSHIGIIPHINCSLCQTTIPHKLFTYMAMGKAVLVSDVKPFKRLIDHKNCGITFRAGSPVNFAEKLKEISEQEVLIKMGRTARELVETEYNWSIDEKRLTDLYNKILN